MAKVIGSNVDSDVVDNSFAIWRIALLGATLGVIYWLFTLVLSRYIDSLGVAGDVATILAATIGVIVMLNLRMPRPLLIAVASAVSLWGLARLTNGLSELEIAIWSALLYCLAYTLFYWINRYRKFLPVIVAIVAIIIILRITLTL